jgi:hypothetical protein
MRCIHAWAAAAALCAWSSVLGCSSSTTCGPRCEADDDSGGGTGGSHGRPTDFANAGGQTGAGDAGVNDAGAIASGEQGDASEPEIGDGCGHSEFEIAELPPNVMILLDRSGSMDDDADGDTRWNVAKRAIETLTTSFDDRIRFGLATYSSCLEGGCSAGAIVVPIAEHAAQAINDFLATTVDEGSDDGLATRDDGKIQYLCDSGDDETSTGKSLSALVGEKSLLDPNHSNAVILLTDAEESDDCIDDCDGPCGAKKLLKQATAVKTYVIGLGVNPDAIDEIAAAGDTDHALGAGSQDELSQAFDDVAKAVASCDYELDGTPEDSADLYVFFNDDPQAIPHDDPDGWSYDAAAHRLQFIGDACTQIESGAVKDIDVVFGCPEPTVD